MARRGKNQRVELDPKPEETANDIGPGDEMESGGTGVAGIAGTGGSSGVGGVRAKVRALGDLSGLDPELEEDEAPVPGSIGKGKGAARERQLNDGGLPGRTRGPDGETIPNRSSESRKGEEGQRPGHVSRGDQKGG